MSDALSVKTVQDLESLETKRVLVRVDFNVPLKTADGNRVITDDTRIRETLPTLRLLVAKGARVILVTHLGRPKGAPAEEFCLAPVVEQLRSLMPGTTIHSSHVVVGEETTQKANALKSGEILVLENVRFEPGEEKNDPALAKALADLCDIYVNDAFGTAHRAHASTEGIAHLAGQSVAGLLMAKEILALGAALNHPQHPYTAIVGGSKVSTKITVLEQLLAHVDHLVIGGAMVFTFLKAQGLSVGNSLVEDEYLTLANTVLDKAQAKGVKVVLAEDVIIADGFKADAATQIVDKTAIPEGWMGLDVGPKTIGQITDVIQHSKMVLWNGPLGVFEFPAFAKATEAVARTLAEWTQSTGGQSILGGGDTVAAIEQFQIPPEKFTHVSSGGGASLEFLEGKTLPGIAALSKKPVSTPV